MTETLWLQITSGRGPVECQLAVARLVPVIRRMAAGRGLTTDVLDAVSGREAGALISALLSISGEGSRMFAAEWQGTIKWICPSPLRPAHKRKNWFVGVAILAAPEAGDVSLDAHDVAFEAMRAGGAGGQHVNKTESAVRATHRPSGLVVVAREERSQHQNKRLALGRLAALLRDGAKAEAASAEHDRWAQHDQLERGDPVRVFEGEDFRLSRQRIVGR
jgi:peptide chain release factor